MDFASANNFIASSTGLAQVATSPADTHGLLLAQIDDDGSGGGHEGEAVGGGTNCGFLSYN